MTADSVLFLSHDAAPTGAPFLLLHLLRWLRENTKLNFRVVLKNSGPLQMQFAEVAPVAVFEPPADSLSGLAMKHIRPYRLRGVLNRRGLRRALEGERFALVYSNTLVNGNLLASLADQRCPVISHSHELEYMIQRFTTPEDLAYTLRRTNRFIAGSAAVARNLVDEHAVDRDCIDVVHDFIPTSALDPVSMAQSAQRIRAELGIGDGAFVAGAAGTVDWRKGYDLFIPLAAAVLRADQWRDVHFVWVGSFSDRRTPVELGYDARKLGLGDRIHFVGYRSNYLEYLAMFDALCLTSREDPFPLVVLEAAGLGKPVLCFEESGGSPEFVGSDCGFVVPYLDVAAMAARLRQIIDNREIRNELGQHGAAKVRERHDVGVAAPRIAEIIQRSLAASRLQ